MLSNIYLTALDERYFRWIPATGETSADRAGGTRTWDRKRGRPTFYYVRYADDFVILVEGTRDDAEAEKTALTTYLREVLHMELSQEKTLVTDVRDGFTFLGYRILKERATYTGKWVGKVRIPKDRLQRLRTRLKGMTRNSSTGRPMYMLLKDLNQIIQGWRNYYQYATYAQKDFNALDYWIWFRILAWLRHKHRRPRTKTLIRRFMRRVTPTRFGWRDDRVSLRHFTEGGTTRYPYRGTKISNGWNDDLMPTRRTAVERVPVYALDQLAPIIQ